MKTHHDLPLFAWTPPSKVIAFPQSRRVGRIRHVAERLLEKRGEAYQRYWSLTVGTLRNQLLKVSLKPAEIETQLEAFRRAVEAELNRRVFQRSLDDGGAA